MKLQTLCNITSALACATSLGTATAQEQEADSLMQEHELQEVMIKAQNGLRSRNKVESVEVIGQTQLVRAACCNLGESFTANPSVDVSYSDAATGAKQIKLLGLSGTYVQMLTENVPNLRGASLPYSLGFVPAPWMQSIQVSKGASSVKNGYESTTGQINIEYNKPQSGNGIRGNAYLDSDLKQELNADGNIHLNEKLSTSTLLHLENRQMEHDGNKDGFMDMPKIKQYNLMHRWAYVSDKLISQLSLKVLGDDRKGGQCAKHLDNSAAKPYETSSRTNRYELQWKNGFFLSGGKSIALMLHGSWHDVWNTFGNTEYNVTQRNSYAQLMFETDANKRHSLAAGLSLNHDKYDERTSVLLTQTDGNNETTGGMYAQYTYKLRDIFTVMPGVRLDYSNLYGAFFTPRIHVKYSPKESLTLRASAGKGYRSPHPLAENTTLLASGRTIVIEPKLSQEEAWNTGISASLRIPVKKHNTLELNAEYYYTNFVSQMVINYDGNNGGHTLTFENLNGDSYSHTFQIDATYPFLKRLTATGAFRFNDVKCTYDGILRKKPLTSRYKGLLTLSFKTLTELWQFDLTGQLNGGGELYDRSKFPAYFQLQAQVTREFKHFNVYLGGENLTNYKIKDPIINALNPWSESFDATQIWGPVTGAMAYIGLRFKFEKS